MSLYNLTPLRINSKGLPNKAFINFESPKTGIF